MIILAVLPQVTIFHREHKYSVYKYQLKFRDRLTYTEKFLGALVIFPVGERVFGMCSSVKAVG